MQSWRSPAKLNWYLRVLDKRDDGYHNIETIFQELDLADELRFSPCQTPECRISGMEWVAKESNLIYRAWKLLCQEYPEEVGGIEVEVTKHIPAGGGLGGGSSNAATTLRALNGLYGLRLERERLQELGGRLGSDVAFFLEGGCAVGRGRGELLTPLEGALAQWIVLYFPAVSVPTAEAYAKLDALARRDSPVSLEDMTRFLREGKTEALARAITNDFELAVAEAPWYTQAKAALERGGARRVFLCGSGSTLAALVENKEQACEVVHSLREPLRARVTTTRSNRASTRFDNA